ncbi:FAD-dependent monooxygenase [Salinifilum ghardaiensis]
MTVLVVGAGPAGLALACGLLSHGVDTRVVDRAARPATTSRANILHARGVEVLDRLGALRDLPQRAQRALRITLHARDKPLATIAFGEIEGRRISALLISQAEVEDALRQRLAELGGRVEWGRELVELHQHAQGVTATVGDEEVRADYVVGCDGAHSAVRELAGIGFPGTGMEDRWLLADVLADWDLDRTSSAGWFHTDGRFFAMPMPSEHDDKWRLMADVQDDGGEEVCARLARLLPQRTGHAEARLRTALWTSEFRINRRLAADYRSGRVLLSGDAAHIHSPFGGQGMNTGIGDAENLAFKLALVVRGRADVALLDTYRAERRPLAEYVLRATTANTKLLLADNPAARLLRNAVLRLSAIPFVQRQMTWQASQLSINYRKGPLGSPRGRRPRPGDRVPDLPCRDAEGRPTRLHAELRGRWALLSPTGRAAADPLGGSAVSLVPERPARETWLVRPDAHLAWRGTDPTGPDRWLSTALRTGRAP